MQIEGEFLDSCVFDVVATRDNTFLEATFDTQEDAKAADKETQEENEAWASECS
jgi:hypothetical protein